MSFPCNGYYTSEYLRKKEAAAASKSIADVTEQTKAKKRNYLPYTLPNGVWNKQLQELLQQKKQADRRYRKHQLQEDKDEFKRCRAQLRYLIKQTMQAHITQCDYDGKIKVLDDLAQAKMTRRRILKQRDRKEQHRRKMDGWVDCEPCVDTDTNTAEAQPAEEVAANSAPHNVHNTYQPSYAQQQMVHNDGRNTDSLEQSVYKAKGREILDYVFGEKFNTKSDSRSLNDILNKLAPLIEGDDDDY